MTDLHVYPLFSGNGVEDDTYSEDDTYFCIIHVWLVHHD